MFRCQQVYFPSPHSSVHISFDPAIQLWSPPTSSSSAAPAPRTPTNCGPLPHPLCRRYMLLDAPLWPFSESSWLDCHLGWALIASPCLLVWLIFSRGRHLLSTLKSLSKRVTLSSLCSITPHSKKNALKMAFALFGRQWTETNAWSTVMMEDNG